jgi:ectoine hydroxylase-related dioxygenase (phytanoyl-CoA dioxygenase family)
MLTADHKQHFDQRGYVVARGLFSEEEAAAYRDHYMELRHHPNCSRDTRIKSPQTGDPLLQYPRLMQMHRWDRISFDWLTEPRINVWLTGLLGREPYAVQTMHYFKPPHARGQALHQDNYYLRVQPGTCIAAWMALDPCDEANGCLQVVPGSQSWPILCTVKSDTTQSFTDVTVPIPEGTPVEPVFMAPGDVLFFNGQIVHGSLPNTTDDRFRRSLIAHYIEGESEKVAKWYHPAYRMDGSVVELGVSDKGSQCGIWVSEDGAPVIEVSGFEVVEKVSE